MAWTGCRSKTPVSADVPDWTEDERLKAEKETLGFYLTGHPYHQYMQEFAGISEDVSTVHPGTTKDGMVAGMIIAMRLLKTRRGKMAVVTLDNAVQRIEVVLFSEKYTEYFSKLEDEGVRVVLGEISTDELTGDPRMRAELLFDVEEARDRALRRLDLHLTRGVAERNVIRSLRETLDPFRGGKTAVRIHYTTPAGVSGVIDLGKKLVRYSGTAAGGGVAGNPGKGEHCLPLQPGSPAQPDPEKKESPDPGGGQPLKRLFFPPHRITGGRQPFPRNPTADSHPAPRPWPHWYSWLRRPSAPY